jgi:hypothetical protein
MALAIEIEDIENDLDGSLVFTWPVALGSSTVKGGLATLGAPGRRAP